MDKLTLSTQLSEQDFIKANFYLYFKKWNSRFIFGIGILALLSVLFLYVTGALNEIPWIGLAFGLYFTVGIPGHIYYAAKKGYKTNKRVSEPLLYQFDQDNFQITGESFESRLSWDKVYSVTETKSWVLIWLTPQVANIVPKRDFSPEQLRLFKALVKEQKGPKNKLKPV
ncbi:YcxB family protein [Rufibacter hautae]|uniref:YcxB family protein n=1 Tax=Rufibacter hautae TaxID=2595005 RepID=A0A5B6TDS5_9BACT|nr:YcxB family protein [Rufibacter hautae]KAA3437081.1 YcxB family protein [Rufibacter hautae]